MNRLPLISTLAALLLLPLITHAQVQDHAGLRQINDIIRGTQGITTVSTGAGVNATAAGTATVTANGLKIPVPSTATASVSKSAIAKAAAKRAVAAAGGLAGGLATAEAVAEELAAPGREAAGYVRCGNGGLFLCKQQIPGGATGGYRWYRYDVGHTGSTQRFSDPAEACAAHYGLGVGVGVSPSSRYVWCHNTPGLSSPAKRVYQESCQPDYAKVVDSSAPAGFTCRYDGVPVLVPAEESGLEQSLQERMDEDYAANKRLYDALKADQAAADAANFPAGHNPVTATTPVSVTAPPVSTPQRTTKVETVTHPDGSTDTKTTKEQTTVSPVPTGSTVGDAGLRYPSQTTITTTTVNNVSNQTTVNQTTINHPESDPLELPEGLAQESTQQQVLTAVQADGAPSMADQGPLVQAATTASDAQLSELVTDAQTGVDSDKSMFFSWVWSPPVGTCSPFAGNVRGFEIAWDMCPTIYNIRDVLGWLLALLSAWTVYGQLFQRYD